MQKGKIAIYSNFSSVHGAFNLHLLEYTKITKPNLAQSLKNAFLDSSEIVFGLNLAYIYNHLSRTSLILQLLYSAQGIILVALFSPISLITTKFMGAKASRGEGGKKTAGRP